MRFIWRTTESQTEQRDFANKYLDRGDLIVVHYPYDDDPTTKQIKALKGVTTVPDSRKGFEFFSLAEIKEHAKTVKRAGFGFIAYDLEDISPSAEVADPVKGVKTAKQYASGSRRQVDGDTIAKDCKGIWRTVCTICRLAINTVTDPSRQ